MAAPGELARLAVGSTGRDRVWHERGRRAPSVGPRALHTRVATVRIMQTPERDPVQSSLHFDN